MSSLTPSDPQLTARLAQAGRDLRRTISFTVGAVALGLAAARWIDPRFAFAWTTALWLWLFAGALFRFSLDMLQAPPSGR